jgi:all-trans-retinol 13,14-reductase
MEFAVSTHNLFDCAVIGSGIGGLTSALYLARRDIKVCIIEASNEFGGFLNPFKRKGYIFDVGVHYVGECGPKQSLRIGLDKIGLNEIQFREINPDCIDRYIFNGFESKLVKGHNNWKEHLISLFPKEKPSIEQFFKLLILLDDHKKNRYPYLSLLARGLVKAPRVFLKINAMDFHTLLTNYFNDPKLICSISGPCGDIGLPPKKSSALASILLLNHYLGGAYYPIGGSSSIKNGYITALKQRGAYLIKGKPVTKITKNKDNTFTLYSNDTQIHSRSIVSNIFPEMFFRIFDDKNLNTRKKTPQISIKPSLSAFGIFLGTDIKLSDHGITDSNIWHYGENDIDALYDLSFRNKISELKGFFLSSPSLKDPDTRNTPDGMYSLELLTMCPADHFTDYFDCVPYKRGDKYLKIKNEMTDNLLDQLDNYIPGIKNSIDYIESATPATFWSYIRSPKGAIYGPELSPQQFDLGRLLPDYKITGLFFSGSCVLGPGLKLCFDSGLLAGKGIYNFLMSL